MSLASSVLIQYLVRVFFGSLVLIQPDKYVSATLRVPHKCLWYNELDCSCSNVTSINAFTLTGTHGDVGKAIHHLIKFVLYKPHNRFEHL